MRQRVANGAPARDNVWTANRALCLICACPPSAGLFRMLARFLFVVAALAPLAAAAQDEAPIDFARQIQPLIARKCLHCHGPSHQEGGLRLDKRESAFGALDSGELGIVPGKPDAS